VWALVQTFEQQSVGRLQDAPATAHCGPSWQRDETPTPEMQESEQHAEAWSQEAPTGKQPVVGLQVPGPLAAGAQ
jgi:hypothetical protein